MKSLSPREGSTQDQRPQTSQPQGEGQKWPNTAGLTTALQPPGSMTESGTQRQQELMASGTPQSSEVRGRMEEVRKGIEEIREGMKEVREGMEEVRGGRDGGSQRRDGGRLAEWAWSVQGL